MKTDTIWPYTVSIIRDNEVNTDIGDWWNNGNINFDDMVVLDRRVFRQGPLHLRIKITYGFCKEDDAIAFRLIFG